MNRRPLTKSRHLTCVAGNYLSLGPSGRRRGNYSSELSGQSELPFGRRQTVQRAGGLPRRSSPGPAEPLTCRRRKVDAHDALPSRRRFCVFWESADQVGKLDSWEDFQDRQAMTLFTTGRQFGVSWTIRCQFIIIGQFGVSASLLLPLHQVGKLDSWEDFQDRQAMTLFTTRSTAGTTEPMSSAPTANGICSLAILPAPRHGTLSRSSATA